MSLVRVRPGEPAGLAQLVERLICNQQVVGSTPASGTRGCSSVWLERRPVTSEAAGSSPVTPAIPSRISYMSIVTCVMTLSPLHSEKKAPTPKPQRKLIELPCIIYRLVAQWESRRLISARSEFNSRQGNQCFVFFPLTNCFLSGIL